MSVIEVAVLTEPGAAADQLRSALNHAGAKVVWQGPPHQFDLAALPSDVIVVNLDPDTEAQLPIIESLLVDDAVRVVFNDAIVSSGLSGWDLQRWARHLAAKVLDRGASAEFPEPPPDAEPLDVPTPEPVVATVTGQDPIRLRVAGKEYIEDVISAELGESLLPYEGLLVESAPPPMMEAAASGLVLTDDLDLITASSEELSATDEAWTAEPGPTEATWGGEVSEDLHFGELMLDPMELYDGDHEQAAADTLGPSATTSPPLAGKITEARSNTAMALEDGVETTYATGGVQDETATAPRQLWVLGGAHGADEAITQFFRGLPDHVGAAFLVVIHFERGDAESLTRSLGDSCKRRVNVAGVAVGSRIAQGDVLVAREGSCVTVTRDGEVRSDVLDSPIGMIDHCARAAADTFGADAGIILFSGGARDGFEGALYIAQRGGVVWAQDPGTCVAGAMADALRSRGLATYIASPRGLAEYFAREFC